MPSSDITLCERDACPQNMHCRRSRFVAKPTVYQSWALFGPVDKNGWCEMFVAAETKGDGHD